MNFDLLFVLLFYFSGLLGGVSLGYMLAGKWASPFVKPEANNVPASTPATVNVGKVTADPERPILLRYRAAKSINREALIRLLQSLPCKRIYLVRRAPLVNEVLPRGAEREALEKAVEESENFAAGLDAVRAFFYTGNRPQPGANRSFPGGPTGPSFGNKSTEPEGYNG